MRRSFLLPIILLAALGPAGCSESPGPSVAREVLQVGASARQLLSAERFDSLVVEIQSVANYAPKPEAETHLLSFLQQRLNKPGGIQLVRTVIPSPGRDALSIAEISALEDRHRTSFTSGGRFAAYFLFVDASSTEDQGSQRLLGHAYRDTSMVIYGKTVHELSDGVGAPQRWVLEANILEHEFGHILGLVNVGSPMQSPHQDEQRGAHCNNPNCLMYWRAETSAIIPNLLGGAVPQLDVACIHDLQANGGK